MSRFSSLVLLCIISFSSLTYAQNANRWGSGIDFTKRAAEREKNRWSLSDWMDIQNRNKVMDMWLTLNSPSPFEFSAGASYLNYNSKNNEPGNIEENFNTFKGEASAYARLVGLTAEYSNVTEEGYTDFSGMFNLRIFGNSIQNTSLTLHYGMNKLENDNLKLERSFGQGTLQVYLTHHFGLEGKYRQYLPKKSEPFGEFSGEMIEAGAFIDFNFLRVYGSWVSDKTTIKNPAFPNDVIIEKTGVRSGIKLFF